MRKTNKCRNVFIYLHFLLFCLASCEQVDVGVSWYIRDNQLNASSELNANTPAKNGRLNFVAGSSWCASTSDTSPYLQIDLQIPYIICAVSTQGNSQGSQWVESYTLQSSTNGTTWTDYKENGQVKVVRFKGALMAWPITLKRKNAFFEIFLQMHDYTYCISSYHPSCLSVLTNDNHPKI